MEINPLEVEAIFFGNLEKMNQHFTMFDSVQIIDTSRSAHIALATF